METTNIEELKTKVQETLNKNLPKQAFKITSIGKGWFGDQYIKIGFAASDYLINNVTGQYPQLVSLSLSNYLELQVQGYGGCGGNRIFRKPDLNHPKEKYLAMKSVKIPFRKPQNNEGAVLRAIEKFCKNWVKAIQDNKDTLMYTDIVDYSIFN